MNVILLKIYVYIQLIKLRFTSTIVKGANMITLECQKNNDSLHANVKKCHTRYYICNAADVLILFKTILLPSFFYVHAYCTFAI